MSATSEVLSGDLTAPAHIGARDTSASNSRFGTITSHQLTEVTFEALVNPSHSRATMEIGRSFSFVRYYRVG